MNKQNFTTISQLKLNSFKPLSPYPVINTHGRVYVKIKGVIFGIMVEAKNKNFRIYTNYRTFGIGNDFSIKRVKELLNKIKDYEPHFIYHKKRVMLEKLAEIEREEGEYGENHRVDENGEDYEI